MDDLFFENSNFCKYERTVRKFHFCKIWAKFRKTQCCNMWATYFSKFPIFTNSGELFKNLIFGKYGRIFEKPNIAKCERFIFRIFVFCTGEFFTKSHFSKIWVNFLKYQYCKIRAIYFSKVPIFAYKSEFPVFQIFFI